MMTNRIEDELLIKKNKELIEKYPFLLVKTDPWTGKELTPEEIDYTTTWFDEIPKGWAKAFGEQMCDELLEILKKADCIDEYEIGQIKEKYTCLDYLGEPVKKVSYGYLYRTPWREDKHPSLSVTPNGKGWKDYATGEHGNLIYM